MGRVVILLSLVVATLGAHAVRVPFALPYDDGAANAASVAFLSPAPAGRDGFIAASGEHFVDGAGERIRFLGVNCSFSGNLPDKTQSAGIAARLAKFGVNCVRHHHMDSNRSPNGLISSACADLQHLDPVMLDRFDYFTDQLRRHGVYSNINLHVGRQLGAADGFPDANLRPGYDKGVGYFHPGLVQKQKEYARDLLTHTNPYSGHRYVDEPAVAMVEISNEDSLIREWGDGELDGMTQMYLFPLQDRWNVFLRARYATTAALQAAWQPGSAANGPELANQDFSGWWTQIVAPASATTSILPTGGPAGEAALHIAVTDTDPTTWHVQTFDQNIPLAAGDLMMARIFARAVPDRSASLSVGLNHSPYSNAGLSRTIALTSSWQEYEFAFTATQTDSNVRYSVSGLASAAGEIWLASPSLRMVAPQGLPAGETLEATSVALLLPNDYNLRSATARADWTEFMVGVDESYFAEMRDYLRSIGVRCPITGTQMNYGVVTGQLAMDFVDSHAYWQHPQFPTVPWSSTDWIVNNVSIQNTLPSSPLTQLAAMRPYGKPYTVTEYNHPAPNTFSAEAIPMLAVMGALQDWDAIFAYSYSHDGYTNRSIDNFFDLVGHSPKMAAMPAAAAIFRRGDVHACATKRSVGLSRAALLSRMVAHPGSPAEHTTDNLGLARHESLTYPIGVELLAGPGVQWATLSPASTPTATTSETGEVAWDGTSPNASVTIVRAEKSKAVVGFVAGRTFDLGHGVTFRPDSTEADWLCFTLTVVAGESVVSDGTWLISLSGYAENGGMVWKDGTKTSCGNQWGSGPPMVEAPSAELIVPHATGSVQVYALDTQGARAQSVPVESAGPGLARVRLGPQYGTLWYELDVGTGAVQRASWRSRR